MAEEVFTYYPGIEKNTDRIPRTDLQRFITDNQKKSCTLGTGETPAAKCLFKTYID